MTRHVYSSSRQRGAFTLIELMVVLAIAAVVSGITLGGFKEMRAGNKRVACSTNLSQLYQAARLYAADEGGNFPNFSSDCAGTPTNSGIGLWALYTFPQGETTNGFSQIASVGTKPVERYLRSSKVLHCPADGDNDQLYLNPATKAEYNPAYLSYQACDGTTPTYATVRTTDKTTDFNLWKRQLVHFDGTDFVKRQPEGSTVVTYCVHHRGDREMDNVLFYDGSIQMLKQNEGGLTSWQRLPKDPQ